jgi:hypothetical protein
MSKDPTFEYSTRDTPLGAVARVQFTDFFSSFVGHWALVDNLFHFNSFILSKITLLYFDNILLFIMSFFQFDS